MDALREARDVAVEPFDEAQLVALESRGMPAEARAMLAIGYPTAPIQLGALTFFPPRQHFAQLRRFPDLFFVADAWRNPRQLRRRLKLEHPAELLTAATDFVKNTPAGDSLGREALRTGQLVYWLPAIEHALEDSPLDDHRVARTLQLLGGAVRWDDYRAEIDKRLLVARSFFLVGLLIALYLITRNGSLPGRLLGSGAALGVVSLGLGLAPWLRENARLRRLETPALEENG